MNRKFLFGIGLTLVLMVGIAFAATISWVPPTTYTDDNVIAPSVAATSTYYFRVENPNYLPGQSGDGYIGEASYPDTSLILDIPAAMETAGMVRPSPGDNVAITVSVAMIDEYDRTIESARSPPEIWRVPLPPAKSPRPPVLNPIP